MDSNDGLNHWKTVRWRLGPSKFELNIDFSACMKHQITDALSRIKIKVDDLRQSEEEIVALTVFLTSFSGRAPTKNLIWALLKS